MYRRLLREPLVHFLILGAAIFLLSYGLARPGVEPEARIVVTDGKIEQLATGFVRVWHRAPSAEELDGLIDDFVREEFAYREALAMGLDKDDSVIRRRLRQKFEFLTEDTAEATHPTDGTLQAWLDGHPQQFGRQPKAAFRQVFLNVSRRGTVASSDAVALLARLDSTGHEIDASDQGDTTMLPHELPLTSTEDIARIFGEAFAKELARTAPGHWAGPLRSSYGLHLVYVRERTDGSMPPLAEVRDAVLSDWVATRRRQQAEDSYRALRAKYAVVVPSRATERKGESADPGAAPAVVGVR
jgi:hypothetical protein